jgi:hypothetical protein
VKGGVKKARLNSDEAGVFYNAATTEITYGLQIVIAISKNQTGGGLSNECEKCEEFLVDFVLYFDAGIAHHGPGG